MNVKNTLVMGVLLLPSVLGAAAVSQPHLLNAITKGEFIRTALSFEDLGDHFVVEKNLKQGETVNVALDLSLLFAAGQGTDLKLTIDTKSLTGIAPECEGIRAAFHIPEGTSCIGTFDGLAIQSGRSAGNPPANCTTNKTPVYKTVYECRTAPICERSWRPFCDTVQPVCAHFKKLDHYITDKTCTSESKTLHFQVNTYDSAGEEAISSRVILEKIETTTSSSRNDGPAQVTGTVEAQSGAIADIASSFYLQLVCENGTVLPTEGRLKFNGPDIYEFRYADIHNTCGEKPVYLQSNRIIHFNQGRLIFTFDMLNP